MKVQCHNCDKKYTLPDARVAGRILKIRCRQCNELFEVDGSSISVEELSQTPQTIMSTAIQLEQDHFAQAKSSSAIPTSIESGIPDSYDPVGQTINQKSLAESQLEVQVSQSAQEWMSSVMSDVDRPITREIKIDEITGHRTLPPQKNSNIGILIWGLLGLAALGGTGYWVSISQELETRSVRSLSVPERSEQRDAVSEKTGEPERTQALQVDLASSSERTQETQSEDAGQEPELQESAKSQVTAPARKTTEPSPESTSSQGAQTVISALKDAQSLTGGAESVSLDGSDSSKRQPAPSPSADGKTKSRASSITSSSRSTTTKAPMSSSKSKRPDVTSPSTRPVEKKSKRGTQTRAPKKSRGAGLPKSTVSQYMQQNAGGLTNCYQKVLKRDPSFGAVSTNLRFKISPEGRVSRSTISLGGVYKRTRLESCIQNTVTRWFFPKADGETDVRYPLKFSPSY